MSETMTAVTATQDTQPAIPDLRDVPLGEVEAKAGPVLAGAVREYRERLRENGEPLSLFNARI